MKKNNIFENSLISIIVPSYKAEKIVKEALLRIESVLSKTKYNYEIICVVDGKFDNTEGEAKKLAKKYSHIKVFSYKNNLGKGHAVRYGMAHAKGGVIGFFDCGLDLNPNGIPLLLEHFRWYNADIMVGSKRHIASKVSYPWQRRILSWGYQMVVRCLFGLKVRDTQVGMKFFRREVLEQVLPRLLVKEFAFDIEMLSVAYYLGYKRIFESPIELDLEFKGSSIVKKGFWRTVLLMLWDTCAVFYRLRLLHYYDSKNKRNWITSESLILKTTS